MKIEVGGKYMFGSKNGTMFGVEVTKITKIFYYCYDSHENHSRKVRRDSVTEKLFNSADEAVEWIHGED